MIRFVTLFPNCENYGLVKDVGQIPYVLGKEHNDIEAVLVSGMIKKNGENIENVEGLNVVNIPTFNNYFFAGVVYLIVNSRHVDWLNIYHPGTRTLLWMKIFKFINPKGKVYLKLDMDFNSCDMYDNSLKERTLFNKNTAMADLVTAETEDVKERIQRYSEKEIKILPNGYCDIGFRATNYLRENAFVTVGRLGTEQKATDTLINAFEKSAYEHDWSLVLVGSIEKDFDKKIRTLLEKKPFLRNRIIIKGEIKDRETLYREYSKAKVFVLPSRWEGFPLVGVEALSCGCRTIVSDNVPSRKLLTKNGDIGDIFPTDDIDALSNALCNATKRAYSSDSIAKVIEYADREFSWHSLCDRLYGYIKEIE